MKRSLNYGYAITLDRRDLREIDYLEKLSSEDFEWLSRFLDNYYTARFIDDGKDVIVNSDEKKECNRLKQRRLNDLSNKLFSTGKTNQNMNVFEFLPEKKKKSPKKTTPKKLDTKLVEVKKSESIEEFLARGGNIKKIP